MIPPGGEGEIKAIVKTKGRAGALRKRVTVISDDPEQPQLKLMIEGEIVVDVAMKPRRISYGQLSKGEAGEREFSLEVREPEKVKIAGLSIDDERFKIERKSGEADGNATYLLKFKGSDKLTRLHTSVKIEITGSEISTVELPVRATVVGDLVYRKSVYFHKRDGQFKEKEIVVASRSNKRVKVTGVHDAKGLIKHEITRDKDPKKKGAVLKVRVAEPDAEYNEIKRGTLVVKTTDPDEPKISIRYSIADRTRLSRSPKRLGPNKGGPPLKPRKQSSAAEVLSAGEKK